MSPTISIAPGEYLLKEIYQFLTDVTAMGTTIINVDAVIGKGRAASHWTVKRLVVECNPAYRQEESVYESAVANNLGFTDLDYQTQTWLRSRGVRV